MRLIISGHAFRRMAERGIPPAVVRSVLETGTIVTQYPEDRPLPSRLILGWDGDRPIHIVSAWDSVGDSEYIVTVYEPHPDVWTDGFSKRRKV